MFIQAQDRATIMVTTQVIAYRIEKIVYTNKDQMYYINAVGTDGDTYRLGGYTSPDSAATVLQELLKALNEGKSYKLPKDRKE